MTDAGATRPAPGLLRAVRTVAIVGPTAVGKTELSLDVAQELGGEIVNADSMQLYRGMDIGTAKVPMDERRGVVHHLLDVLDVTEWASVAGYQAAARRAVADIHERGRVAVVVGGSGLFVNALLDDMRFPGSDTQVREALMAELDDQGPEVLHARLTSHSPEAAAHILPTNGRRIVRALEVVHLTGQPPITQLRELPEIVPAVRIGLRRERAELDVRIASRVEVMMQAGLVDEVRSLEARGLRDGPTASKALGYRQVLDALSGETTMEQAVSDTVAATRRYVRRQESWFARDTRITWFAAGVITAREVAALVDLQSGQT